MFSITLLGNVSLNVFLPLAPQTQTYEVERRGKLSQ